VISSISRASMGSGGVRSGSAGGVRHLPTVRSQASAICIIHSSGKKHERASRESESVHQNFLVSLGDYSHRRNAMRCISHRESLC
jgi:hypothetical protein